VAVRSRAVAPEMLECKLPASRSGVSGPRGTRAHGDERRRAAGPVPRRSRRGAPRLDPDQLLNPGPRSFARRSRASSGRTSSSWSSFSSTTEVATSRPSSRRSAPAARAPRAVPWTIRARGTEGSRQSRKRGSARGPRRGSSRSRRRRVWPPGRLAQQVSVLQARAEVDGSWSRPLWFSWTGKADDLTRDHVQPMGLAAGSRRHASEFLPRMLQDPRLAPCTGATMFRRRCRPEVGGFRERRRPCDQLRATRSLPVASFGPRSRSRSKASLYRRPSGRHGDGTWSHPYRGRDADLEHTRQELRRRGDDSRGGGHGLDVGLSSDRPLCPSSLNQ